MASPVRSAGHLRLAAACAALGGAGWASIGSSRDLASAVVAAMLFLGPGLAVASWRRSPISASWWLVFPVSCASLLLATRLLLALELYRPRPIASVVAVGLVVSGTGRLVTDARWRSWIDQVNVHALRTATRPAARRVGAHARSFTSLDRLRSWPGFCAASLAAWLVGCLTTSTGDPSTLGLLGELSIAWYIGVALAAIAVVLALGSSSALNAHPLAVATVVVVLVLHGTAPLVYESARYTWTFKHIGLADYFAQYHDNDRAAVDIYHAFPAFFASLGVVAGTSTARGLEVVARWWPLFVELGSVLVIRRLFRSICWDERVSWVAALLFVATNWIGQDYLSPQSASVVLALTIHAIAFRQLDRGRAGSSPAAGEPSDRHQIIPIVAILACWTAIVVAHPLTPFMVLPGLFVAFPLFRFRPRWLPLLMAAIALGYAFVQRGIIGDQGVGRDVGNVVTNVQGRGTTSGVVASRVPEFAYYFAASLALSAILFGLAALGTRTLFRSVGRRRFVGICCLATSPTLFLAVDSYGQEGVLRAFLFASPWLCLSAAMLLVKIRGRIRLRRRLKGTWLPRIVIPTLVGVSAALACVALFVRDEQFAVSASDVEVVRRFEELEPNGGLLIGTGVLPERVTAQYFRQRYVVLGTPERFADGTIDAGSTLALIRDEIEAHDGPVYMAFGPSLTNRTVFDGRASAIDLEELHRAVDRDTDWKLVFREGASTLYHWVGR